MSPRLLAILLHYYFSAAEYEPGFQGEIDSLISAGLLMQFDRGSPKYGITERARVYLKMLLETPFPVWADPRMAVERKDPP
jgi:hypothetical protein